MSKDIREYFEEIEIQLQEADEIMADTEQLLKELRGE